MNAPVATTPPRRLRRSDSSSRTARLLVPILGWLLLLAGVSPAQDDTFEHVKVRVISTEGDRIVIDHGTGDDLAVGDVVLLFVRGGGTARGTVVDVSDRSAVIEMLERNRARPGLGTRGEVLVPKARRRAVDPDPQPAPRTAKPQPRAQGPGGDGEASPSDREWTNRDEDYKKGMPLLAGVRPVRPEQRDARFRARLFAIGELTHSPTDDFDSTFFRVGLDSVYENPFGSGGTLHVDGEIDYRTEQNEKTGFDILPRRVSYRRGATRFAPNGLQIGRFLLSVPELGILDGFEYTRRLQNGSRIGGSIGFQPEPDDDFESGEDLTLSAYYEWVADETERLTVTSAFQKSFHNGEADRDLFVFKTHYLPEQGWDFHGTVWVDYYTSGDDIKGSGIEITEALVATGRTYADGSGMDISFRRLRFPEVLRNEFRPLPPEEIADSAYDRLAWDGWQPLSSGKRLHGHLSGWNDEDDEGGTIEGGMEIPDMFVDDGLFDLTAYATFGRFQTTVGGRATLQKLTRNGSWDALYEFQNHHYDGFSDNRDDMLQHRLRGSRSWHGTDGWSMTLYGEARLWDDEEFSWTLGTYVQRRF